MSLVEYHDVAKLESMFPVTRRTGKSHIDIISLGFLFGVPALQLDWQVVSVQC